MRAYDSPTQTIEEMEAKLLLTTDPQRRLELQAVSAFASYILGIPEELYRYREPAYEEALAHGRTDLAVIFSCTTGYGYQLERKMETAKGYIDLCEKHAYEAEDNFLLPFALENKAFYYLDNGKSSLALSTILSAVEHIGQTDLFFYYHIQNSKAVMLDTLGYSDQAVPLLHESLDFFKKQGSRYFTFLVRFNLSKAKDQSRDIESLIQNFEAMLKIELAEGDDRLMAYPYQTLAQLYVDAGRLSEAINMATLSIGHFRKNREPSMVAASQTTLMEARLKQEETEMAARILKTIDVDVLKNYLLITNYYKVAAEVEKASGNLEKTIDYYKKLAEYSEISRKKDMESEIAKVRTQLDLQTETLRTQLAQTQLSNQKNAFIRNLIIIVVSSITLMIVYLLYLNRKSQKTLALMVQERTRDIRAILDTINQGVVTIESPEKLSFGIERSKAFQESLGFQFETIPELLKHSQLKADEINQVVEALRASIDHDELAFDCNEHLLPRSLTIQHQGKLMDLELEWVKMYSQTGDSVEKILLSIKDLTEMHALELEKEQQRYESALIHSIIKMGDRYFSTLFQKISLYITDSIKTCLLLSQQTQDDMQQGLREIFLNIHTAKGLARSVGLVELSSQCHEAEEQLDLLLNQETKDITNLQSKLLTLEQSLSDLQSFCEAKLSWDLTETKISFPRDTILAGLQFLESYLEEQGVVSRKVQSFLATLERFSQCELRQILLGFQDELESLARKLKKEVPHLKFLGPPIAFNELGETVIHSIFTHVFRNAMDHGIERPAIRESQGKPPRGTITIDCRIRLDILYIDISDDGYGLQVKQIEEIARQRNLINEKRKYAEKDIVQLIFEAGFSSRDEITSISGRGVGMAAIRSYLNEQGGSALIILGESQSGDQYRPFTLQLQIPRELWWESFQTTQQLQMPA
ncbi:ATP-binding protein [Pseudobacteriovorax antillogorgiicola]|uniref:histidine kinase n=1 Tax=Pseudobacteriovorax antillogorgiicola TaxID=1513793 RepID=A0A1Y6CPG2_9BACT|nr:ATP-binding protein [Pseudobacteriovorax antillogorgiicola]TCS43658.1 Hpt domain-containing protein [Pseudobacteriovorax antillogorgiicola]SMF79647.1 Hpt domain-containing protein [Pseudobacteriovorax antillogorgiicola]